MTSYSSRDLSIANRIRRGEDDLLAMKTTQLTGRANMVMKNTSTQLIESIVFPLGTTQEWQVLSLHITFNAEKQVSPYARIGLTFYKSDAATVITDTSSIFGYIVETRVQESDGKYKWYLSASTPTVGVGLSTPIYVQVKVAATDNGTITVERGTV